LANYKYIAKQKELFKHGRKEREGRKYGREVFIK
jgi:hypothetical protein